MFHSLFESTTFQYVYLVSWCAYCIYIYIYFCCIPTNFSSNCHYSQWLPQSQCTCVCSVVWSNIPSLLLEFVFSVSVSVCFARELHGQGKNKLMCLDKFDFPWLSPQHVLRCRRALSTHTIQVTERTNLRGLSKLTKICLISKGNTLKKAVLKLKSSKMMKVESIESIIICQK